MKERYLPPLFFCTPNPSFILPCFAFWDKEEQKIFLCGGKVPPKARVEKPCALC